MVISCSAPGCMAKKNNVGNKSVQFHRFPLRKPEVLAKWIKAMKCPNFRPTATSYLCSAHFTNSDYDPKSSSTGKHLKSNAVPSYFEKKRPGRKKKVVNENESGGNVKSKSHEYGTEKGAEGTDEEYLQVEADGKVESNLAEIIGDRDKGTLQVLIVGEDGKITNSEYIFKKEMYDEGVDDEDEDFKIESDIISQGDKDADNENILQAHEVADDTSKGNSTELTVFNYDNVSSKGNDKIKQLEGNLSMAIKKIKHLQMKYKKISMQNKELKFLLKLLILKRGKGEKNLKQLLNEYKKCEYDAAKVKQEFYVEN